MNVFSLIASIISTIVVFTGTSFASSTIVNPTLIMERVLHNIPQLSPTLSAALRTQRSKDDGVLDESTPTTAKTGSSSSTDSGTLEDVSVHDDEKDSISILVGRPSRAAGRVTGKRMKALADKENRLFRMDRKVEEIKKLRMTIEKRTELFIQSSKQQQLLAKQQELLANQQQQAAKQQLRLFRIMELRRIISVFETAKPEIAAKARAILLDMAADTLTMTATAAASAETTDLSGGSAAPVS
jgi:hypothetical protein